MYVWMYVRIYVCIHIYVSENAPYVERGSGAERREGSGEAGAHDLGFS